MFDMTMPEEVNRVLVDHVSDLNFCPTRSSVKNLAEEGVKRGVYFSGDTMLDAFLRVMNAAKKKEKKFLKIYSLEPKKYFLLTLHRPANVDDCEKLQNILQAVIKTGENIIFPTHPRTRKQVDKITDNLSRMENFGNIKFIDPVGYTEMVILEKNARKICTDSGGIQKEAYWLKVPCVTLLESQGWPELHCGGWNILVGSDANKIYDGLKKNSPKTAQRKYFGNGASAKKILKIILK
jgi:UDP-N-acetylglucosamine 2-epimerase (non-hydrolysing)